MKGSIAVIALTIFAAVAAAHTFEPSVTSTSVIGTPSATPRRIKSVPRRTGTPKSYTGTTTINAGTLSFGDTPGLNGTDMMNGRKKRKKPKHHH